MPRTRSSRKRPSPSKETDEEPPQKKASEKVPAKKGGKNKKVKADDSSSDSDIDDYLQRADEIDLNSSFFQRPQPTAFEVIEKTILSGVNRLSDSESEPEDVNEEIPEQENTQHDPPPTEQQTVPKINFQHLHEYTRKIEEARKHVQAYEAKKVETAATTDVSSLLATGEKQADVSADLAASEELRTSLSADSDEYDTMSDEEKGDWEEVKQTEVKEVKAKDGLEITVELPGVMRQKKGVDLVAAMKRRLNRVKKEQQVLIHKVHLLCWVAHGNFVNNVLNSEKILGLALSLIPSQHCYPPERVDLNYLEKILEWYHKTVKLVEKKEDYEIPLQNQLQFQVSKKEANSKRLLVFIFICILRSLGIHCRLVLSFVVLPLRPPSSQLLSLSTKTGDEKSSAKTSTKTVTNKSNSSKSSDKSVNKNAAAEKSTTENGILPTPSTSKGDLKEKQQKDSKKRKTIIKVSPKKETVAKETSRKKSTSSKHTKTSKTETKVPQLDGTNDSEEDVPASKTSKPQLKKLKATENVCAVKKHPRRLKSVPAYTEVGSEDDFEKEPMSPTKRKPSSPVHLKKFRTRSSSSIKETTAHRSNPSPEQKPANLKKLRTRSSTSSKAQTTANDTNLRKLRSKSSSSITETQPKKLNKDAHVNGQTSPLKKPTNVKKPRTASAGSINNRQLDVRNDIIGLIKGRMSEQRHKNRPSKSSKRPVDDSDDSDYYPEPIKKKVHDSEDEFIANLRPKVKKRVQVKPDRKVFSSESDTEATNLTKRGVDVWLEVFLDSEEKWISVDVIRKQIHCVKELYMRASHPITYVVGWNNEGSVKDVTQRYCPNWNTVTRKLRVDPKWLQESLRAFAGRKTARDREEDEELAQMQLEKPLPTTISEYKNHPLYVLRRHLLKFEALYPTDIVPLGYVRSEPVYSRDNVYTLHSREIWVKHAKVVKPGETPYKIVKARPKYDRLSNTVITDLPLEIFGPWQVEDYVPPTAENGVVPRNAYGNVELFKACMLPNGTVHLQLPGLNRVARKMNIDCAPAVVGFDYHSGGSHPTFDGFIVCEEFSEQLVAAYIIEEEEAHKRAQEKFEKKVYDNWRRLIKGLLIRERLKARYDFGEPSTSGGKGKKKPKRPGFVVKRRRICSDNEGEDSE